MEEQIGVVVMLDILGTKSVLARTSADAFLPAWENTISYFRRAVDTAVNTLGDLCTDYMVAAFSDTLIVTLAGPDVDALLTLVGDVLAQPFSVALGTQIFLRGVVSTGVYYRSRSEPTVIGPALDEAAAWYEQTDWAGIAAAPSTRFHLDRIASVTQQERVGAFRRYPVPWKSRVSAADSWAVSWPELWQTEHAVDPRVDLLTILAVPPIIGDVLEKYLHILKFYDTVIVRT